jgi:hypothetical protein
MEVDMGAPAASSLPWPRFALRRLACPPGTPDEARQLLEGQGLPERGVGAEYVAMDSAALLDDHPNLLAFGRSGLYGRICLDVVSLAVVHVPNAEASRINPVNSDLAAFTACIDSAISRFPYYTYESADELGEEVANVLRDQLLSIDAVVGAHNGMWETFLDDVAMGNYAEEEFDRAPTRMDGTLTDE